MWAGGLLPAVARRGHAITALAPLADGVERDDAALEAAGIAVTRYPVPYFDTDPFAHADPDYYRRQNEKLRGLAAPLFAATAVDAVLFGTEAVIPGLACMARQAGVPTIGMVHTIYWATDEAQRANNFGPGGTFESLSACDQVVCVARHALATLEALDLKHATAIQNAVDLTRFAPKPRPRELAAMIGIAPGAPVVLHVANLKPVKQSWRLLDAAPAVLARHPETVFLLLGEGPCADDLRAQRDRLGLGENVKFLGWTPHEQLPDYYALADVMALPSASESAPFAYLEALAVGCAVVATPIPAAYEFLREMPAAIITPSHEPGGHRRRHLSRARAAG